jgi:hypothetical protein
MKAKKKPLDEKNAGRLRRRRRAAPQGAEDGGAGRPQGRRQGQGSVAELVSKLKNEAGVI